MTAYIPDNIDSAVRNLNDLLDVICDLQFELGPKDRDSRIDSLLWIARDVSEGIVAAKNKESAANMAKHREASR